MASLLYELGRPRLTNDAMRHDRPMPFAVDYTIHAHSSPIAKKNTSDPCEKSGNSSSTHWTGARDRPVHYRRVNTAKSVMWHVPDERLVRLPPATRRRGDLVGC